MVIEFIGTPGAGKTTLVPIALDFLRRQGIGAHTYIEAARPFAQRTMLGKFIAHVAPRALQGPLLWQVFYGLSVFDRGVFLLRHPRLMHQVVSTQLRRPIPWEARRHALRWFIHLTGYYQLLQGLAQPDEALILDEGFVHRVVQMNASPNEEPDAGRIAAYLHLVPRPDLVIAVHAPWEVCLNRIYRRGLWERFSHNTPEQVARYVYHASRSVNLALAAMRSAGWTLIDVENGGDEPHAALQDLHRQLALRWAGLPQPIYTRATV